MSSSKPFVHQHRKKKYVYQERSSPFPVPIASITREKESANYWYHFMGEIVGNQVLINHSGDISYLSSMGFFGRGLLSRGPPTLYNDLPYVHIPTPNDGDVDVVHVMRKQMYLRHMKWRKSLDKHGNKCVDSPVGDSVDQFEEEFDSDVDYNVYENDQLFNQQMLERDQIEHKDSPDSSEQSSKILPDSFMCDKPPESGDHSNTLSVQSRNLCTNNPEDVLYDNSANQRTAVDSWDNTSASQNAAIDLSANQKTAVDSWDTMEADEDFWVSEDISTQVKDTATGHESHLSTSNDTTVSDVNESKKESTSPPCKKVRLESNIDDDTSQNQISDYPEVMDVTGSNNTEADIHNTGPDRNGSDAEVTSENQSAFRNTDDLNNIENEKHEHIDSEELVLPLHPLCNHDDITDIDTNIVSDYIVINDSDIDDNTEPVQVKQKTRWLPVRKKEVFQFNEPLVLSFDEAFFLCYGLGCLTVTDKSGEALTISDLWCRFNNKQFLPKYVAYHYFRSKGWVPKLSALFGTDMLVYKVGPAFFHASYSVIIKTVYEGTMEEVPGYNNRRLTWSDFSGLNRVTEHVAKMLVLCYVIMPQDLSEEEMSSPQCLSRFKVRLQLSQRWVSSQEREQGKQGIK